MILENDPWKITPHEERIKKQNQTQKTTITSKPLDLPPPFQKHLFTGLKQQHKNTRINKPAPRWRAVRAVAHPIRTKRRRVENIPPERVEEGSGAKTGTIANLITLITLRNVNKNQTLVHTQKQHIRTGGDEERGQIMARTWMATVATTTTTTNYYYTRTRFALDLGLTLLAGWFSRPLSGWGRGENGLKQA